MNATLLEELRRVWNDWINRQLPMEPAFIEKWTVEEPFKDLDDFVAYAHRYDDQFDPASLIRFALSAAARAIDPLAT